MGKFRMSHGKESKSVKMLPAIVGADETPWIIDPGLRYATRDEVKKAMTEVLETHKATFQALAKHDISNPQIIEKHEVIRIPAKPDNWARKHSIESRKQSKQEIDAAIHLSSLLAKDCHDRIERLEQSHQASIRHIDENIDKLQSRKPEEKQIVKEITVMKSEIPKSIWIGMGILLILNILTIMIK